ncbi:MAG: dihydroorotate dehydrogenase electron transfer subunit [Chloroflexi bacterium]|nr:dihydroorotate dehydrogenase electron transfer subunit [Chloroflexota bacterium]
MRLVNAGVVLNREVVPGVRLLRLTAPEIARDAAAGQFVHVRAGLTTDPLLRRPISLHAIGRAARSQAPTRADRDDGSSRGPASSRSRVREGEIDILFAKVGRGTSLLADSRPGDSVNLLGPLGRGFRIDPKTRNVLLVAGGLGLAPLAALAAEAVGRDLIVTMLCGFKSQESTLPPDLLPPEVEYVVCTEDGSLGRKGLVTEFVGGFLEWADEIFACGPRAMLSALARNPLLRRIPVQASLEERMACGVGACFGCTIRTRSGLKQVCRDGPVFRIGDVEWE